LYSTNSSALFFDFFLSKQGDNSLLYAFIQTNPPAPESFRSGTIELVPNY